LRIDSTRRWSSAPGFSTLKHVNRFLAITLVLLAAACAGCSTATSSAPQSTPEVHLDASLVSPVDVKLKWKSTDLRAAGHTVEWGTESNGEFVIVAFAPPEVTSFVHPDVVPEATSFYRVRPYFGPAASPIEIATGPAIENEPPNAPDGWLDPKTVASRVAVSQASIRNPAIAPAAAPTDFSAQLVQATGILLTWTDHASDEDGYMLEIKTPDTPDFKVCAVLDPNINSFGYALVPPETKVRFRLRPFYFGRPSNVVSQRTGVRPPDRKDVGEN
jgi:hypothetical protein